VTHSSHPLMLPARHAARVITIHDLNFLEHPERTRAEVRRDYPALAVRHAHRADRILVSSNFTAREVECQFGVPKERIALCPPGAPDWPVRATSPADGYVLFVGTLEPRKNLGGLLDAYERLLDRSQSALRTPQSATATVPELVLAGRAPDEARGWLDRIGRAPLAGMVRHVGYFDPPRRRELYSGSFEEGFGLPGLEAMTIGVPVVAARRGALPEVLGDAGLLVDPHRPHEIADAIARLLDDRMFASECAARGVARARTFRWDVTARTVYDAYQQAIDHHAHRR